jgi:Ferric uptake regulator family
VSHQAVYDVLSALTNAGLLRRIQPSGSVAGYEARIGDNHHHAVCRSCATLPNVDCAVGEEPYAGSAPASSLVLAVCWACDCCDAGAGSRWRGSSYSGLPVARKEFALAVTNVVLDGGVGRMIESAQTCLRSIPGVHPGCGGRHRSW